MFIKAQLKCIKQEKQNQFHGDHSHYLKLQDRE